MQYLEKRLIVHFSLHWQPNSRASLRK